MKLMTHTERADLYAVEADERGFVNVGAHLRALERIERIATQRALEAAAALCIELDLHDHEAPGRHFASAIRELAAKVANAEVQRPGSACRCNALLGRAPLRAVAAAHAGRRRVVAQSRRSMFISVWYGSDSSRDSS